MALETFTDLVCTFCGCGCDDISVTVQDGRVKDVKNGCAFCRSKLMNYSHDRLLKPMIRGREGFKEVSLEEAVEEAASILAGSRYPLLYGWSSTSCEATSLGIELAELLGGVIDNTSTVCHGPTILGLHDVGEATCTLGDVRNRADLVIYWGCNPVHAHPRHMPRFILSPGRFRRQAKERRVIVVDVRRSDTAKSPLIHRFLQLEPGGDFELLSALRTAVRMDEIEQDVVAGISREEIEEVAEMLISCECGMLFFGLGLTMSPGKERNIDAAISLVRDLNKRTKFLIMPMRGHGNVTGSNKIITWQTGYSYAVDFSRGYPRYNPGDTTTVDILARGDCDSALVVASDPISNFPFPAARYLAGIPMISLDYHPTPTTMASRVVIPTAPLGIEAGGTVYRMDGVPLMAKAFLQPSDGVRSDEEVLKRILEKIRRVKAEGGG
jgi:formylmethanofuran dehydrogenase subunit B